MKRHDGHDNVSSIHIKQEYVWSQCSLFIHCLFWVKRPARPHLVMFAQIIIQTHLSYRSVFVSLKALRQSTPKTVCDTFWVETYNLAAST